MSDDQPTRRGLTTYSAVAKALAETAERGAQHRRERAEQAAEQRAAHEARRAEQPTTTVDGRPTLGAAIRAALAEPEPEYNPWKFERPASLWEAIGNEVSERIARGETRQRELHQHYGFGDREPGRAGR